MLYLMPRGLPFALTGGRAGIRKTGLHSSGPDKRQSDSEGLMALKIYNTLTREKEPFEPLVAGRVNMYVCGPTVYDSPHIGHAKSAVSFDIVVRYLRYLGHD